MILLKSHLVCSSGYNLRPLEMSGVIGIEQLKKLPDFIKHRQIMQRN